MSRYSSFNKSTWLPTAALATVLLAFVMQFAIGTTQDVSIEKGSTTAEGMNINGSTGMDEKTNTLNVDEAPHTVSRFVSVGIDLVAMGKEIAHEAKVNRNRGAFVKNTCNIAMHRSKYGYNVMVFNLQQSSRYGLKGIVSYSSVNYDGTTFGVWIFKSGWWVNEGAGTFNNWCFNGEYKRSGKSGKTVHFW